MEETSLYSSKLKLPMEKKRALQEVLGGVEHHQCKQKEFYNKFSYQDFQALTDACLLLSGKVGNLVFSQILILTFPQ